MDLRWRQQWRTYRILYAKTIDAEKLPKKLTFIFYSCQTYFWQEFLIFTKLVKTRNLLWKLKIFFYLCVNQVQHRVKRCKSAVGYSVYLKWGQSIKDWYTAEYGKGSFSSLSAINAENQQIAKQALGFTSNNVKPSVLFTPNSSLQHTVCIRSGSCIFRFRRINLTDIIH